MSKNIVVQQDGVPQDLDGVAKIITGTLDGMRAGWIPEDETLVGEITITQNGEYVPYNDGLYGYWKVNVMVAGGEGAEIDVTPSTPSVPAAAASTGGYAVSTGSSVTPSTPSVPSGGSVTPTVATPTYSTPVPASTSPVGCSGGSIIAGTGGSGDGSGGISGGGSGNTSTSHGITVPNDASGGAKTLFYTDGDGNIQQVQLPAKAYIEPEGGAKTVFEVGEQIDLSHWVVYLYNDDGTEWYVPDLNPFVAFSPMWDQSFDNEATAKLPYGVEWDGTTGSYVFQTAKAGWPSDLYIPLVFNLKTALQGQYGTGGDYRLTAWANVEIRGGKYLGIRDVNGRPTLFYDHGGDILSVALPTGVSMRTVGVGRSRFAVGEGVDYGAWEVTLTNPDGSSWNDGQGTFVTFSDTWATTIDYQATADASPYLIVWDTRDDGSGPQEGWYPAIVGADWPSNLEAPMVFDLHDWLIQLYGVGETYGLTGQMHLTVAR